MNIENKYELVKFVDGELELEISINPSEETIWLSQEEIAVLYGTSISTVNYHIKNIYEKKELKKTATFREIRKVQLEGNRTITRKIMYYNLDMIISIGYRVNSVRGVIFRIWANKVLKDYLLRGYVINDKRVIVSNDNFNNLLQVVNNIQANQIDFDNRLNVLEDAVLDKEYEFNKFFFDGQFYDAYTLIQSFFESANNEIIIIDNYVDRSILDRLIVKKSNVKVLIYTNINTSRLIGADINSFNSQYGGLDVKYNTNVHDRFIIIDQMKFYHLGQSIKDLGKKIFSINELDNNLIQMFLNNI